MPMTRSASARQAVGGEVARDPDGAEVERMVKAQAALACHGLAHGDAGLLDEVAEHLRGVAVDHAAARHNQRAPGLANPLGRALQRRGIGRLRSTDHTRRAKNSAG